MIVCAKCGASNAPGDAFCGECGAYLEWAAEPEAGPAAEPEAEARAEPEPEAAVQAAAEPPPEAAPELVPAVAAAPPPPVPEIPSLPPAAPSLPVGPTCPACGRVNTVGRTFCQSCGARLPAGAARVPPAAMAQRPPPAPPPPASRPAPVPAPPVPVVLPAVPAPALPPVPPTLPAIPPEPPTIQPAPRAGAGPGGSRTLSVGAIIVIVVLLAIVGIGGFLVLGGGGSATASASPAATAGPTPAPAAAPTGETSSEPTAEASVEPSPEPTPAPTAETTPAPTPAGPPIGITITKAAASTENGSQFTAAKAIDGSPLTAWTEGARDAEGQWLEITIPPTAVTRIVFSAGVQASRDAYDGNPRPKNVTIAFDGGTPIPLALTDTFGQQRVEIPAELGITAATTIRITIIDAFAARKTGYAGSPTTAVGFSEMHVFGVPATP